VNISVNENTTERFQIYLPQLRSWLTILAVCLILGSLGLGWLVKSALIIVGLVVLTPVIGFLGFIWWLRRSIVQAECPVCSYPLQGINGSEIQCGNCGEVLNVAGGKLIRETPPDTIDTVAVEVIDD
jgi:hypothetical protein